MLNSHKCIITDYQGRALWEGNVKIDNLKYDKELARQKKPQRLEKNGECFIYGRELPSSIQKLKEFYIAKEWWLTESESHNEIRESTNHSKPGGRCEGVSIQF